MVDILDYGIAGMTDAEWDMFARKNPEFFEIIETRAIEYTNDSFRRLTGESLRSTRHDAGLNIGRPYSPTFILDTESSIIRNLTGKSPERTSMHRTVFHNIFEELPQYSLEVVQPAGFAKIGRNPDGSKPGKSFLDRLFSGGGIATVIDTSTPTGGGQLELEAP